MAGEGDHPNCLVDGTIANSCHLRLDRSIDTAGSSSGAQRHGTGSAVRHTIVSNDRKPTSVVRGFEVPALWHSISSNKTLKALTAGRSC